MSELFPRQLGNGIHLFSGSLQLVAGPANVSTFVVIGSGTSGQSFGISVAAGTTAADYAIQINNKANNATFFQIFGDGHGQLSQGAGAGSGLTWNASGAFNVAAPGSGTPVTINTLAGQGLLLTGDASANYPLQIVSTALTTNRTAIGFAQTGGTPKSYAVGIDTDGGVSNSFEIRDITRNAIPFLITTAGNASVAAPTSGATLSLTTAAGGQIITGTDGTISATGTFAASEFNWGTASAHPLALVTGGNARLAINGGGGNVTINAPSDASNYALTVKGAANAWSQLVLANSTSGQSFGLLVQAGTTTADQAFQIESASTVTYFLVYGNGEAYVVEPPASTGVSGCHQIGYVDIPQNLQNATYATVATDRGKSIDHTAGSPHTYTINDATVNYPVGASISFDNGGSGVVTIALQTTPANLIWGPSGSTGNRSLAQYGVATARKISAGTPGNWRITGVGLT